MSVKIIVFLLMLLIMMTQVTACEEHYTCNSVRRPMNCTNNSRIRISKSSVRYQLVLCANDPCSKNITINFKCCDICEACRMITTKQNIQCGSYDRRCEERVDAIFDSYCLSATSATSPAQLAPTITSYSRLITPTFSLPFSTQAPTKPIISLSVCENGSRASASENESTSEGMNHTAPGPVIALAVLFCLSVMLLAMVTIGWVYTCLVVKKRDAKKHTVAFSLTNRSTNEETASSTSAAAVTTYDAIANSPSQARAGQTYDILSRGQATGQTTAMAAQRTVGDASYSQLGPRDCERVNEQ